MLLISDHVFENLELEYVKDVSVQHLISVVERGNEIFKWYKEIALHLISFVEWEKIPCMYVFLISFSMYPDGCVKMC